MTHLNRPPRPRILLVDDETDLRMMLGFMLTEEGYDVNHAANGTDAVRLHRDNFFQLVIIEMMLSDKCGLETLAELRRQPGPAHFIATAKPGRLEPETVLQMARRLGAHSTLAKPFLHEEMLETVKRALK
jgi:DNA-binding response OmpR family regulator